jgi:hypothetical protein
LNRIGIVQKNRSKKNNPLEWKQAPRPKRNNSRETIGTGEADAKVCEMRNEGNKSIFLYVRQRSLRRLSPFTLIDDILEGFKQGKVSGENDGV